MNTLIIVLAVLMAGAAIVTVMAFYRGWFRLASVPAETKGQFLLMAKKNTTRVDALNITVTESSGPTTAQPPLPNDESH